MSRYDLCRIYIVVFKEVNDTIDTQVHSVNVSNHSLCSLFAKCYFRNVRQRVFVPPLLLCTGHIVSELSVRPCVYPCVLPERCEYYIFEAARGISPNLQF